MKDSGSQRRTNQQSVDPATVERVKSLHADWKTPREIAAETGLPLATLRRLTNEFDRADIEAYWAEGRDLVPELSDGETEIVMKRLGLHAARKVRDELGNLMLSWRNFVQLLEREPWVEDPSYTNDLDKRSKLQRVANGSPPRVQRLLLDFTEPLDIRFRSVTKPTSKPLGGWTRGRSRKRIPDDEIDWWYFREPKEEIPFEEAYRDAERMPED